MDYEDSKMPAIQEHEPSDLTPRHPPLHNPRPTPTVPTPNNSNFSKHFNRYTPNTNTNQVASLPSAAVPKTTNATAGRTPYTNLTDLNKRKLDFDESKDSSVKMSPMKKGKGIISMSMRDNMNFWFYIEHPDGWVSSFAARGKPTGKPGYVGDAFKDVTKSLQNPEETPSFAQQAMVSSVQPRKDSLTSRAKKHTYKKRQANGKD